MYLRRHRRRKKGQNYDYWTLVESVRTAKGPRQRIVAHIGKEPGLDEDERLGWEQIGRLLDGDDEAAGAEQLDLFTEDKPEAPLWAQVNLGRIRVERVRQFGKVYVALALWRRLGAASFLRGAFAAGPGVGGLGPGGLDSGAGAFLRTGLGAGSGRALVWLDGAGGFDGGGCG